MKLHFIRPPCHDRPQSGATAVEFALIFPVFLLLVLGLIEAGRAMYAQNVLSFAVQEATRYAIVRGSAGLSPALNTDIEDYARDQVVGIDPVDVVFAATFEPDNDPGSEVVITATYSFQPFSSYVPLGPFTLTSESRMVIAR